MRRRRRPAWLLIAAVASDAALWVGLGLVVHEPTPAEPRDEELPLVDLAQFDLPPNLPVLDAPEALGARPTDPRAQAQHDHAPARERRHLAPPGPIRRRPPVAPAASAPAVVPADGRPTPTAASAGALVAPLPLVEGSEDVPEELPLEDETEIASVASPLAAYLDGIRRAVRVGWQPSEVYGALDPAAARADVSGRTELRVRLAADGELLEAVVLSSSGLSALDQEAVAAFRRTQPFHPVPEGVGDAGGLSFRFAFLLDLERARFLRAASHLLRAKWPSADVLVPVRRRHRLAAVRVVLHQDGAIAKTVLEIPSSDPRLNQIVLELVADVGRFPRPPESLMVDRDLAQFRAAVVVRPGGSDQLRVFNRPMDAGTLLRASLQ